MQEISTRLTQKTSVIIEQASLATVETYLEEGSAVLEPRGKGFQHKSELKERWMVC